MSSTCSNADAFADTLSAMVRELCERFMQQENEELARLRIQVIKLQDELTKVKQGCASQENYDADKPVAQLTTSEVQKPPGPDGAADSPSMMERQYTPEKFQDLQKKFQELDPHGKGFIGIEEVIKHRTEHLESKKDKDEQAHRYRRAVDRLNNSLGIFATTTGDKRKSGRGDITFASFEVIMVEELATLQDKFGKDAGQALIDIRESLIDEVVVGKLAQLFHVTEADLYALEDDKPDRRAKFHRYLEPVVGSMIMLNAFVIGFSLDIEPDWNGWFVVECIFSTVFSLEFAANVWMNGCSEHFLGEDWFMNWFECVIVWSAILDSILTAMAKLNIMTSSGGASYHLLLLRLVRLLRITRILRVLRLKVFKDLTLMVNGVIGGLRTLFWAIVLLTFLLYVLGVFMRQVVHPERRDVQCGAESIGSSHTCNRGEQNLEQHGEMMFGTVFRSMLTMFTCFTEGCSSPDGTPFIWHLWDSHGPLLVIGYVASFVFVTFGVFNLIMAVMVQNTMDNAKQWDADRQFGDASDLARKAHRLHKLLGKLCTVGSTRSSPVKGSKHAKGLKHILKKLSNGLRRRGAADGAQHHEASRHLHLQVNQDQFDEIMMDKEVNDFLDDLDISGVSRGQLFDILDADGSGFVSVTELVDGLMKLRGPADKGDVIATSLCVRQLQKQVLNLEELMEQLQSRVKEAPTDNGKRMSVTLPFMQSNVKEAPTDNEKPMSVTPPFAKLIHTL